MSIEEPFSILPLERMWEETDASIAATLGDRLLLIHRGRIVLDVQGAAKRRLSADDLAYRFDRLRSADQLDESAARALTALYV